MYAVLLIGMPALVCLAVTLWHLPEAPEARLLGLTVGATLPFWGLLALAWWFLGVLQGRCLRDPAGDDAEASVHP